MLLGRMGRMGRIEKGGPARYTLVRYLRGQLLAKVPLKRILEMQLVVAASLLPSGIPPLHRSFFCRDYKARQMLPQIVPIDRLPALCCGPLRFGHGDKLVAQLLCVHPHDLLLVEYEPDIREQVAIRSSLGVVRLLTRMVR